MIPHPTKDSTSIFQDGKLKPGIYKIRNVFTETYADIEVHSRGMCCRPAQNLEEGRGLWEIKPLGAGYSVQRVEPGAPEQFCTLTDDVKPGASLSVTPYPVAWRIEVVDDVRHRGFQYVRFCWGITERAWAVRDWSKDNGAKVVSWTEDGRDSIPLLMWKLIPAEQEIPPAYEGDGIGQPPNRTQRAEAEYDDVGTVVTEVTTVTTTTRKRYRVEGA